MSARIEPITGRYMYLDIHGQPHRLYFEEAGQGIPLLCLHTAGSDGRQFRALLNDPEITANYRVIAFDMPWHGKSSPPEGFQDEEYLLTTDGYVDIIVAVAEALELDGPVPIGCSIGGRIVLELAKRHPEKFRCPKLLSTGRPAQTAHPWWRVFSGLLLGPCQPLRTNKAQVGDAMALHARRSRCVQRRSAFLFSRRRCR